MNDDKEVLGRITRYEKKVRRLERIMRNVLYVLDDQVLDETTDARKLRENVEEGMRRYAEEKGLSNKSVEEAE